MLNNIFKKFKKDDIPWYWNDPLLSKASEFYKYNYYKDKGCIIEKDGKVRINWEKVKNAE